jgi:hypothetical protein
MLFILNFVFELYSVIRKNGILPFCVFLGAVMATAHVKVIYTRAGFICANN